MLSKPHGIHTMDHLLPLDGMLNTSPGWMHWSLPMCCGTKSSSQAQQSKRGSIGYTPPNHIHEEFIDLIFLCWQCQWDDRFFILFMFMKGPLWQPIRKCRLLVGGGGTECILQFEGVLKLKAGFRTSYLMSCQNKGSTGFPWTIGFWRFCVYLQSRVLSTTESSSPPPPPSSSKWTFDVTKCKNNSTNQNLHNNKNKMRKKEMTHDRYLPDPDLPEDLHPGAGMPGAWEITRGCEVVVSSLFFLWRLEYWNPEKLQEKILKK